MRYDIVSKPKWIGLENYYTIFQNADFLNSLKITLYFLFSSWIPLMILSFIAALLVNQRAAGSEIHKVLIYTPVVISEVVASMIARFIFHPEGILNLFLKADIFWMNNSKYVIPMYIILTLWKNIGYFMVIFLAGLQIIPEELYESSDIDGANILQKTFHITIPLIRNTLYFAAIIGLVNIINLFTPFYSITNGGPANQSQVLALLIYKTAFNYLKLGKASAMTVVLLLIMIVIMLLYQKGSKNE
jgi:ABC-type sugar transport system permease subunit